MKEYRLISWPELPAPFGKTAYRRMLTDMSHRHMSLAQLVLNSGVRRHDVQQFLDTLDSRGVLAERDNLFAEETAMGSLRPFSGWLRKAFGTPLGGR